MVTAGQWQKRGSPCVTKDAKIHTMQNRSSVVVCFKMEAESTALYCTSTAKDKTDKSLPTATLHYSQKCPSLIQEAT